MKSLYLHKMLQIFFVPQKSKNGKAYPKKKKKKNGILFRIPKKLL